MLATDILARRRGGGGKGGDDSGGGSFSIDGSVWVVLGLLVVGALGGLAWRNRDAIMRAIQSNSGGGHPPAGGHYPPPPPADVAAAMNPATPAAVLKDMVNNAPPLRQYVARNPAAEPGLLQYLGSLGDPAVNAALASRGPAGGPPPPGSGGLPYPPQSPQSPQSRQSPQSPQSPHSPLSPRSPQATHPRFAPPVPAPPNHAVPGPPHGAPGPRLTKAGAPPRPGPGGSGRFGPPPGPPGPRMSGPAWPQPPAGPPRR